MIAIIIIIIIFIIFYFLIFVRKHDKYQYDPLYDYSNIKPRMKTGDIILFACRKFDSLGSFIKYTSRTELIGSPYGHVGIILRNGHRLYVMECTSNVHCADEHAYYLNNLGKGGIRIIDLDILIHSYYKEWGGNFAIRFISEEIPHARVAKNFKLYKDKTFGDTFKLGFLTVVDMTISHDLAKRLVPLVDKSKYICSEFAYEFLYRCGILKKYPAELFWPHLFMDDKLFSPLQLVKYSKPFKFIPRYQNFSSKKE